MREFLRNSCKLALAPTVLKGKPAGRLIRVAVKCRSFHIGVMNRLVIRLAASWRMHIRRSALMVVVAYFGGPLAAQALQLVSSLHPALGPADGGSGDSLAPIISPDGRYIVFASTANNLVLMGTNNPIPAVQVSVLTF